MKSTTTRTSKLRPDVMAFFSKKRTPGILTTETFLKRCLMRRGVDHSKRFL